MSKVFRVQSLKRTIILQFAMILLPLVALLAFEVGSGLQRSEAMSARFRAHDLADAARDQYRAFLVGAEDAVDSGRLSAAALEALIRAAKLARDLSSLSGDRDTSALADDLIAMEVALAAERNVDALRGLLPRINAQRDAIARLSSRHQAELDQAIAASIDAGRRDAWVAGALALMLAFITTLFILRMVRGLSRPLALAVSVADRIAEGRTVAPEEFRSARDVGNLLKSLAGMHANLERSRTAVEAANQSLQDKIGQLVESQSSLAEAQHLAQIGSWMWDPAGTHVSMSDQMIRLLGVSRDSFEPTLENLLGSLEPQDRKVLEERIEALRRGPGLYSDEFRLRCLDGTVRTVHHQLSSRVNASGKVERICGVFQDITQRRKAEEEIRRLAHYDSLTGLPNRRLFHDQLQHAIARARRERDTLATLFLDLDRFKRINDTLGHGAGDTLLCEVARRLSLCVRESDLVAHDGASLDRSGDSMSGVARLAGDEFTATLVGLRRPQEAAIVARRILAELAKPIQLGETEIVVSASIGIAVYPGDGDDAEDLLKNADAAMYRAKELGRNAYQFFAEEMNRTASSKLALEMQLRKAIERQQFVLHYQPKIDAATGRVRGVEALVRWMHPERGLLPPDQFIPLAEEVGLITELGDLVLEAACRQMHDWREAGLQVSVAVNLASPSLEQPDLIDRVQAALGRHGIEPRMLQLEATESMMMHNIEHATATLNALRALGVRLSIDDFGTGYSSLSQLRRLPIDQLKIDRSFVMEMNESGDNAAIVDAVVSLGRSLGLEVVAEGVENEHQARRLRELGCDLLQGFLFSRPLPPDEVETLLRQAKSLYPAAATAGEAMPA